MRFKMRKVKSWLRWAKRQYEEKYNIKITEWYFPKKQLKAVQEMQLNDRYFNKLHKANMVRIKPLKVRRYYAE